MIKEASIEKEITRIFESISFPAEPEGLYKPLSYMIEIGGKRIRPRLCLTSYALYKDAFGDGICEAARALEVFHAFTLIHDDIMDKAPLRRGVDTVWKKWGQDSAILSGDVMCIDSYRRLSCINPEFLASALELFSKTAAQVCEGQRMDMEFESEERVSMNDYMAMIGLKTAVLLACSAKMGAIVAGASQKDCGKLYDFGYNVGLAFQIADDWLDTFGDSGTFGKAIGGDILNNKKTWLLTRAMEKDMSAVKEAISLPSGPENLNAAKIAKVTALYKELGVDKDAEAEVRRYNVLAMESIESMNLSRIQAEMLSRYAARLVGRSK